MKRGANNSSSTTTNVNWECLRLDKIDSNNNVPHEEGEVRFTSTGMTVGGQDEAFDQLWPLFTFKVKRSHGAQSDNHLIREQSFNTERSFTWPWLEAHLRIANSTVFLLHHEVSLRSLKRHFGCFSQALVALRSLSEHGSNMLCKQADCSLGRFSKPAMCTAALSPNQEGSLSNTRAEFCSRCQKEPSWSEPCKPTHGEPQGSAGHADVREVHIAPGATTSCTHMGSSDTFGAGKTHLWGYTLVLSISRSLPQNCCSCCKSYTWTRKVENQETEALYYHKEN